MNDRAVELLGQYEMEVRRTRKGRGAILCETDKGCLIFKEYSGNQDRIELQEKLLEQVAHTGLVQAESVIPNKEGSLLVKDNDGVSYVLKTWRDARECNIHDKEECAEAVRLLARLHESMVLPKDTENLPAVFQVDKEYEKHNRELKRVRKFLRQKGQKTGFEINLLHHFDFFLDQAVAITEEWKEYCRADQGRAATEEDTIAFCHGDYQYHNILRDGGGWFLVNFEKCLRDNPIRDLYLLLRKLLEKSNWSVDLGAELLEVYEKERQISAQSWIDLYYRFAYPEKFWKIVNFYYNSGKAWIPGRNQEKLDRVVNQEEEKQKFLTEVFRNVERLGRR